MVYRLHNYYKFDALNNLIIRELHPIPFRLFTLVNVLLCFFVLQKNDANSLPGCEVEMEVPEDITICEAEDIDFEASIYGNILEFYWTQNGEFLTDSDLNPSVYVDQTSTFVLTAFVVNEEDLIVNGDFESGDYIEYTDYFVGTYSCYGAGYLDCEGSYGIETNPNDGHTNFAACSDMSGGGSMMVVNGAPSYQQIWCQTIDVIPGAFYQFSAWATSVNPSSPAQLQFAIDGVLIGDLFSLSSATCSWEEFFAEWTNDGASSVEICITNQNTSAGGNDFALDNIAFHEVCMSQDSFTVTVSDFDVFWNTPDELTCLITESSILLDITPEGEYDIFWESDQGGIIEEASDGSYIIVDSEGEYLVTITDEHNCSEELDIYVEADQDVPEIYIDTLAGIDCDNELAVYEADSDQNNVVYQWFDTEFDLISEDSYFETYEEGHYILVVTDLHSGCENAEEISVATDTIPPSIELLVDEQLNCHNELVPIYLAVPFGTTSWEGPQQESITAIFQDSVLVNDEGWYHVEHEADNHCIAEDSIYVTSIERNIEYDLHFDTLLTCHEPQSNILIELDTSLFELEWLSGNIDHDSLSFDLSQAGEYVFEVTDSIGCQVSDTFELNEDFTLPSYTFSGDTISCAEPEAILSVGVISDDITIEWIDVTGTVETTDTISTSVPGSYHFTVTAGNGCSISDSFLLINGDDVPIADIEGDTLNCIKQEAELTLNISKETQSIEWLTPSDSVIVAETVSVSEPGNYQMTAIDIDGCRVSLNYQLLIDTISPDLAISDIDTLTCVTTELVLSASSNVSGDKLFWTGSNYNTTGNQVVIDNPGLYSITALGKNGCLSHLDFEVPVDTIRPEINIDFPDVLNCYIPQQSPVILNTPDSVYWEHEGSIINEPEPRLDSEGIYTVYHVGKNGCVSSMEFDLLSDFDPPVFDLDVTPVTCIDSIARISLDISSDYDQVLAIAAMDTSSVSGTFEIAPQALPSVLVIGQNGCRTEQAIPFEFDTIPISFTLDAGILDCSDEPVFINFESQETVMTNDLFFEGLSLGTLDTPIFDEGLYTVTASGANGCIASRDVVIERDSVLLDFELESELINCRNEPVYIELSSVSGPYISATLHDEHFLTVGDLNTPVAEPGTYTVYLTGNNHCVSEATIEIEQIQDFPDIGVLEFENLNCEDGVEFYDLQIMGGSAPYTVTVGGLDYNNEPIYIPGPGTIQVLVSDSNGCNASASFEIEAHPHTEISLPEEINIKEGQSLQLHLELNRPLDEISLIDWSPKTGLSCYDCISPYVISDNDIEYMVTVVDIDGCIEDSEIRIYVEEQLNYYVPNVINLNDGGQNKSFGIYAEKGDITNVEEAYIFDRWGNRVFSDADLTPKEAEDMWDGLVKSKEPEQGVYTYLIKVRLYDDQLVVIAGNVTVLK